MAQAKNPKLRPAILHACNSLISVTRYYQRRRLNSLQQKSVASCGSMSGTGPLSSRQAQIVAKGGSKFECP